MRLILTPSANGSHPVTIVVVDIVVGEPVESATVGYLINELGR